MPYMYIQTAGYHLCKGDRLMTTGGPCNSSGSGSVGGPVSQALTAVGEDSAKESVRVVFPEQSTDAIIYVTIVVVFYAAIILLLVGTNLRRFRPNRSSRIPDQPRKDLVVYTGSNPKRNRRTETAAVASGLELEEEVLNPNRCPEVTVV